MKRILLFITLILLSGQSAHAYEGRYWLMFGVEAGFQNIGSVTAPEVTKDGAEFGFKLLATKYFERWVGDFAIGYRGDKMTGSGTEVRTKAFLSDISFRYRINDRLHVGPIAVLLFGQDVSFSQTGTNSDDKSLALFLGLKALYDIPIGKKNNFMLRLGGQAITDINISNRQVTAVQFLAEAGFPIGGEPIQPTKIVYRDRAIPEFTVNLSRVGVHFETGKAVLLEKSIEPLKRFARALVEHSGQYDKVFVGGHTDKRGDYARNVKLSKARAQAVANIMVEEGVSAKRIITAGYGPDKPLVDAETEEAYQKNRRVEFQVLGATSVRSKPLIEDLKSLVKEGKSREGASADFSEPVPLAAGW